MVALLSHWHTLCCSHQFLLAFRSSVLEFIYFRNLPIFITQHSVKKQEYFLLQHTYYFSLTAAMAPFSLLMTVGESVNKQIHLLLLEMNGLTTAIRFETRACVS